MRISEAEFKRIIRKHAKPKSKPLASVLPALKTPSPGEEAFGQQLTVYGIAYEREHRFCPDRRWRIDFWLKDYGYWGVEIEGGIWANGRHNRPSGFLADIEKYNMAAALGWRILRFTTEQVKSGHAIDFILNHLA